MQGIENIPRSGRVIFAANHNSHFDFMVLVTLIPRRIFFLAAEMFFQNRWWRPLVKLTGQIRVDRASSDKSETLLKVRELLERDRALCIFPEGTRSATGEIQKAYNGAVKIAYMTDTPIIPVGITGTFNILSRFMKIPRFSKECVVVFGKPINVRQHMVDMGINELTLVTNKVLMAEIRRLSNE